MNYNWHIGQDIVCIKTHSEGDVKEGDVYTIKGLKDGCCGVEINVGLKIASESTGLICRNCEQFEFPDKLRTFWLSEILFAPLEELTDISEVEEILNQPIENLLLSN